MKQTFENDGSEAPIYIDRGLESETASDWTEASSPIYGAVEADGSSRDPELESYDFFAFNLKRTFASKTPPIRKSKTNIKEQFLNKAPTSAPGGPQGRSLAPYSEHGLQRLSQQLQSEPFQVQWEGLADASDNLKVFLSLTLLLRVIELSFVSGAAHTFDSKVWYTALAPLGFSTIGTAVTLFKYQHPSFLRSCEDGECKKLGLRAILTGCGSKILSAVCIFGLAFLPDQLFERTAEVAGGGVVSRYRSLSVSEQLKEVEDFQHVSKLLAGVVCIATALRALLSLNSFRSIYRKLVNDHKALASELLHQIMTDVYSLLNAVLCIYIVAKSPGAGGSGSAAQDFLRSVDHAWKSSAICQASLSGLMVLLGAFDIFTWRRQRP